MNATQIEDRIAELSREPDWRAALHILTSATFRNEGRVWQHVDLEHRSIYFSKMLKDGTFSGGEIRLLQIAASLFSQEHKLNLWRALGGLDQDNARIAIEAMQSFCQL